MKILITGGAGFVGSHAAEYYASKNKEVVVIDNLSRANSYSKNLYIQNTASLIPAQT